MKRLICTVLFCISYQIHSAPVLYDESINGELNSTNDYLGDFDVGLNRVIFREYYDATSLNPDDWFFHIPAISFTVPNGMALSQVSYSFTDVIYDFTPSGFDTAPILDRGYAMFYWSGDLSGTLATGNEQIDLLSIQNSGLLFNDDIPLSNQTYLFTGGLGWLPDSASWTIEVGFEVSNVPVPASAVLFFSGLLGLIGIARANKCRPNKHT